ncbi:Glu/Leu/Phe/Val dehydrogenase dimerization domain-containing protein [Acinetobacter nematophilus]|uniref:Glu/Leu/Phe/Val dehydrogenase dimerization domain-containing protein n=1 Tax=Acinetobacter TaxID=469 RepID=UPI00258F9C9F|nr:Glu/Leu/Phe/Val dehydrogenase dimerization domain-containing protein [Acinetobacter sp.]
MTNLSYISQNNTARDNYLRQLKRIEPYLNEQIHSDLNFLQHLKRILIVDIPVEMNGGSIEHFEGFHLQHSLVRSPYKDGIRLLQDVELNDKAM